MLRALVHRIGDISTEPCLTKGDARVGDRLTVQPRGATGSDLLFKRQVRAHRDCHAPSTLCVIELAQFDDRASRSIARGVQIRQANVMGAPIDAVNDGVGSTLEFVIQSAIDQAANDGLVKDLAGEDEA